MDYYKRRTVAARHIRNVINATKEIEIPVLTREIKTKFGFGRIFVERELEDLKEEGKVDVFGNSVKVIE